jgi:fructose-bisphosphate aldolase, class I
MTVTINDLASTGQALVAGGKGILAADETVPTVTRRLDALKIESTAESRRAYREMFFTTPGIAEFISGVIMQDETIHQRNSKGTALADLLAQQGILPGIKVDNGAKPLAGSPGENITEGLDGLRDRLKQYRRNRCALRQMARGDRRKRYAAERHLRECECARARSLCRTLPRAGSGTHR